jgi:hypothetical protein
VAIDGCPEVARYPGSFEGAKRDEKLLWQLHGVDGLEGMETLERPRNLFLRL